MATAALGSALGGAGGGGGGGMPDLKFPEKLAENIDFQPGGVGCICCSSNATINQKSIRLVQNTNPDSDAPFAAKKMGKSTFRKLIDKVCCCCSSSTADQVAENADAIGELIAQIQSYEESQVKGPKFQHMVGLKAGVALEEKMERGEPLVLEDYVRVQLAAEELKEHAKTLELMLKHLEYYTMARQTTKSPESDRKKDEVRQFKYKQKITTKVDYPNVKRLSFREKKLKKSLRKKIPCKKGISKETLAGIVEHVKQEIEELDKDTVSPDEIKKIVAQDLKDLGIKIEKPPFLKAIDDPKLRRKLSQCKDVKELTHAEFETLYKLAIQKDMEFEENFSSASTEKIALKKKKKKRTHHTKKGTQKKRVREKGKQKI